MKMRRNQKLNTYTLRVRVFRFHIKPILHLLGILWRGEKISGKKNFVAVLLNTLTNHHAVTLSLYNLPLYRWSTRIY